MPHTPPPERISLVEMVIMLLLMSTVTAIAMPRLHVRRERAGTRACYANQKTIVGAMEMYNLDRCGERLTTLSAESFRIMKSGGYLQTIPHHPGQGPNSWHHYKESTSGNGITCTLCGSIQ